MAGFGVTMNMTRYKTNRWLWLCVSLSLFLACWFIPFFADKDGYESTARFIAELIASVLNLNDGNATFGELSIALIIYTLVFGIPSILIGWLVQCAVVVIRTKKRP
jgi:hypothetical protein